MKNFIIGSFFIPLILIVFIYFKIFLTQKKVADKRQNIKTTGSSTGSDGEKQIKKINKVLNQFIITWYFSFCFYWFQYF